MVKTLTSHGGLWPQSADNDDTCFNENIGLWLQDALSRPGEPMGAQMSPGEFWRADWSPRGAKRLALFQDRIFPKCWSVG